MMASDHLSRWDELLPAYSLGALDAEERRELEAHLSGCADCRRALAAWERLGADLAQTPPPVPPAATTRARLLRAVRTTAGARLAPRPASRLPWLVAAAALALAVWAGAAQVATRREARRLEAAGAAAAERLAAAEQELFAARTELARLRVAARIVGSPAARAIVLAGLGPAPGASARAYVDPGERRALFHAWELPPPPAGKTYQLWFIADGRPVSAGTFEIDPEGHGVTLVEDVAPVDSIQAWAVTIEPAGGVPQPTGEMVLRG
jgi:anti-sigma-K factor RskA